MSEDHHDEEQFESAESGAAATFPKQCSALRKNDHVMIGGRPCKVVDIKQSKTRKSFHIQAIDIFTNEEHKVLARSTSKMDVPVVKIHKLILTSIREDGYCSLMGPKPRDLKDDLKMPDGELGMGIRKEFEKPDVCLHLEISSFGGEHVISGFENEQDLSQFNCFADCPDFLDELKKTTAFFMPYKHLKYDKPIVNREIRCWINAGKLPRNFFATLDSFTTHMDNLKPTDTMYDPLPSSSTQSGMQFVMEKLKKFQTFLGENHHQTSLELLSVLYR
ncbi:unnamed protein product [Caenorhabditis brenneri]